MKNGLIIKGADFSSHKISNTGQTDWSESGTLKGQDGFSPTANVSKSGDTATITITDKNGTTTTTISDGSDGFSPTASVSKSGDTATITITDQTGTTTTTIHDGQDGQDGSDGQDGNDGFSPTASVSKSGKIATITITDQTGTTTTTISDGQDGSNGQDGQDGFSPTASVSKSGDTATITITDKTGTTTTTIQDGRNGQDGVSPTVTAEKTGGTTTLTITNASGTPQTVQILDGQGGGDSVYVGSQTPASETVSLWVDTSGDVDIDTTPTQNSNNLITSGGVYSAIASIPTPTPEIFWATYGTTTASEIQTALGAGKLVMCKYTDRYYLCTELSSNVYNFTCTSGGGNIIRRLYVSSVDDSWSTNTASLELTINRLASSSQTAPSDSNYYSALATKNLIDAVDFRKDTDIDLSLFGKILCIGDSWTQGVFDYRDDEENLRGVELPQYSYPTLLASLTGRSVTNKGDAGKTSTTWYSNHSGDVLKGHDACIIFLGINDVSQGDTSQTSTSLTNIITKVKTDNPDVMKIFLVSMPNHLNDNTYAQTVNGILQSVAESEGAYYLDISGVVIPRNEAHPLAIGYEILAKAIYNKASEVMRNNRSDFGDIFTMTGSNGSSMDSDGDSILLGSAHLANQVVYSEVDLEANPKGYIDKDTKEFVGNDDFVCSGFVYIKGISKVEYKVRSNGVSVPFCFYDKDKQLIPALTVAAREDAWTDSIDLTGSGYSDACYLVMSSWTPAYPPYLKLRGKYDFESFLKIGDIEYTEGNNLFNPGKVQAGVDINTAGNIGFNSRSVLSDWINIPSGAEAIYFKGLPTYVPDGSTHRFGCWYNANKEVIGAIDLSPSSATSVEILPTSGDEVRYLRFTVLGNPPAGDYDISSIIVSTEDIPFEPYQNSITSIAGYSIPTLTSLTTEDINRICV